MTTQAFKIVSTLFMQEKWEVQESNDGSVLRTQYHGKNAAWYCVADIRTEDNLLLFYSIYPDQVSEVNRLAITEFIARANYGLTFGNFEIDLDDGEIRFKTSISLEYIDLNIDIVKQMVYTNLRLMDQYVAGILAVISDELSPEDAIAQIENN